MKLLKLINFYKNCFFTEAVTKD